MDYCWTVVTAIAESASACIAAVSTIIAAIAICQTVRLHKRQMLLERRQLLLPLWSHLQSLSEIDPSRPVWPDVIRTVNALELIAVCWEGQLIDQDIIRRMYSQLYIEFYQNIQECKEPPAGVKDGKQMLLACPAVVSLYNQLIVEYADRDKLTPIR